MGTEEDRRRFPRLSTGPEYVAHFEVPGIGRLHAQVQNLSACGCGLQVQICDIGPISQGGRIEALYLDHPDLPYIPLDGTVARVLGKVPGKSTGYALVGIDFSAITPFMMRFINGHILSQMEQD